MTFKKGDLVVYRNPHDPDDKVKAIAIVKDKSNPDWAAPIPDRVAYEVEWIWQRDAEWKLSTDVSVIWLRKFDLEKDGKNDERSFDQAEQR